MRRLAVGLAVLLLFTGCSSGDGDNNAAEPPATTTTTSPTVPVPKPIRWNGCDFGAPRLQCATVEVPLDYADPDGSTIDLAVARWPATDPSRRIGSLVTNPGGPGGSGLLGIDMQGGPFSDAIKARFDIVSWDPRGIGRTSPLGCRDEAERFTLSELTPDDEAEQRALEAAARRVADACRRAAPELLAHMSTADAARDLESIRLALGGDPITYYGFSYGTFLGLRYAELFPDGLRAYVLDGVVDPSQDAVAELQTELAGFGRAIAAYGEPTVARLLDVAGRADRTPLTDAGGRRRVNQSVVGFAAVVSTYDVSFRQPFEQALVDAQGGNGAALALFVDTYLDELDLGAFLAVICTDLPHPDTADDYRSFAARTADLATVTPDLGEALANSRLPCAFWPEPPTGEPGPVRAAGAPAALVVGNTGDSATPVEASAAAAAALDQSALLVYDGEGHTTYGKSACADRIVDRYVFDVTLPPEGARCRT